MSGERFLPGVMDCSNDGMQCVYELDGGAVQFFLLEARTLAASDWSGSNGRYVEATPLFQVC